MIKRLSLFFFLGHFFLQGLDAQFAIEREDLPQASSQYVYSIASTGPTTPPLGKEGQGIVWDYTDMDILTQEVDSFFAVSNTPYAYRAKFDNPFDPEYLADHAYKVPDRVSDASLPIQIEDRFDYYRKTDGVYELLGIGATINGLFASAKYEPKDSLHPLPLSFDTTGTSYAKLIFDDVPGLYYEQEVWRDDTVDGEGRLVTPYKTYEPCLRLKSEILIRDSLKSDSLGIDTAVLRPKKVLYEWMAEEEGVPVMRIVERAGTINRVEYRDSLRNTSLAEKNGSNRSPNLYPNPTGNEVELEFQAGRWKRIELWSLDGKKLWSKKIRSRSSSRSIKLDAYPSGAYLLRFVSPERTVRKKLIKRERP